MVRVAAGGEEYDDGSEDESADQEGSYDLRHGISIVVMVVVAVLAHDFSFFFFVGRTLRRMESTSSA